MTASAVVIAALMKMTTLHNTNTKQPTAIAEYAWARRSFVKSQTWTAVAKECWLNTTAEILHSSRVMLMLWLFVK